MTDDPFLTRLAEEALTFDFFEAVRRLECLHADLPRVGASEHPREDFVRFRQSPSLAFAPTAVQDYKPAAGEAPAELRAWFFGLFGPNGALPFHLTEFARDRLNRHRDATLVHFLDVFHHRAFSLFYRAWSSARRTVDLDRPQKARGAAYVGSLFGLGLAASLQRDSVPDWTKLFFSGRLAAPKNPEGLAAILAEDFGVPATVWDFQGKMERLPADARAECGRLGTLGQDTFVGESVFLGQSKFRLRLGPLTAAQLRALLPGTTRFRRLRDWVLNYSGREFFWDAQLLLQAAEVPPARLGGEVPTGTHLGWTSWLKTKPFARDAEDLVLLGDN